MAITETSAEGSLITRPEARRERSNADDQFWREGRIPFPVRIGVTGHRDPHDPEALSRHVRDHLSMVRKWFAAKPTMRVCFTILSSLAEGADRLVVREAFEFLGEANVELHAVLPMDSEKYRRDFATPESKQEFDELLDRAAIRTHTLPTSDRDEAYERAGRWMVEHSDVVIALWDGHPPSGRGGTAEIACYARRRKVPVLLVPTARTSIRDRMPREVTWRADLAAGVVSASEAYVRIEEFNRCSVQDAALAQQIGALEERFSPVADGSSIHWLYENVAEWALPRLARADTLAVKYQRIYYRLGDALYGSAALAVTAVAVQAEAGLSALFALFEVAFMLILLVMFWSGRRAGVHDRWLGYRSLAEAFRSALCIQLAATDIRTDSDTGELGSVEEPWFQRAFSEAWRQRPSVSHKLTDIAALRRFLVEAWLDDQVAYHRKAVVRFERERTRLTKTILVLFTLTFVIGIVHSFEFIEGRFWVHVFVFLAIALPGFGRSRYRHSRPTPVSSP